MAVSKQLTRRDTVILVGPLNELYITAGPIIQDYLSREWVFESSQTSPNIGPKMELRFVKERASDAS